MAPEKVSLREHLEAIAAERDHRYEREGELRAEALKIKEEADAAALALQRKDQEYKDEKANELREQIGEERSEVAKERRDYLTLDDYERRHEELAARIAKSENVLSNLTGRLVGIAAIAAIFIAAVSAEITHLLS